MLVRRNISAPVFSSFLNEMLKSNHSAENALQPKNARVNLPAVNIKENDNEFVVEMAAPGFLKEDFHIDVKDDVLTIVTQIDKKAPDTEVRYTRREYKYDSFKRVFGLPKNMIDTEKIAASYTNGELIIQLPKRDDNKPKPSKTIDVA